MTVHGFVNGEREFGLNLSFDLYRNTMRLARDIYRMWISTETMY